MTKKSVTGNYIISRVIIIVATIILGSAMVYGLNSQISRSAFFILVILFFLFTKDTTLGISLLFILVLNPWGLFYYKPYDIIIPITSKVGVSYQIPFALIILVRYIFIYPKKGQFIIDFLRPYYRYFVYYFLFMIIWGLVFGYSVRSLYDLLMSLSVLSMFLVLPRAFNFSSMMLFNNVIFLFCLLHTVVAIIDITLNGAITTLLIFGREASTASIWAEGLTRLTGGIGISFYTLFTGMFYLAGRQKVFSTWFLWLVVLTSWFAVLNTATRGWMIASIFMVLAFSVYYFRIIFIKNHAFPGLLVISFVILILLPGRVSQNLNSAFDRLSTVEAVTEGDMTAEGTAGRWTIRGPRVLTRFSESPVFGFGFSEVTAEYWDEHVGNHILLLMGGVVGFIIVWTTVISILLFIYRFEKRHKYFNGILVFGMAIIGIMIIHSTSRLMISFIMPADSAFIIALLFGQINALIFHIKYGHNVTRER